MGRGWRAAERRSQEVTDRVLATAPPPAPPPPGPAPATAPAPAGPGLADPLAALVQIGALLGPEAPRLLDAWRVAAAGDPSLSPSQALAMAEAGPPQPRRRIARELSGRLTRRRYTSPPNLVGVAQLVELLVVVQAVGGSSPLAHPSEGKPR